MQRFKRFFNPKFGFVFIFLVILQFSLLPLIPTELKTQADYNKYVDYTYLYVVFSYTMIVIGVIIFRAYGLEILSDHFTLWLIIFSTLVRSRLGVSREFSYILYLVFLGLVLIIYVVANRKTIKTPNSKRLIVGLLWSIVTLIVITLVHAILDSNRLIAFPENPINYIISGFLFQISFVTVIEEVCFRGLIFGFLILNGYKEDTAFIIQALLFWVIHYSRISNPILFFISIPLLTLSTTLIVRKYKTLYLSIMIHTIANIFAPILAGAINRFLF